MIAARLFRVEEKIIAACERSRRKREEITLVAVTKGVRVEEINSAIELGVQHIGENRVQEYLKKKDHLRPHTFHLVGHLQTNKVKQIVHDVSLIHSVDSVHLAQEIEKQLSRIDREISILLEVNTSNEESKYGVAPEDVIEVVNAITQLPHIDLKGFMTVAAFETDIEKVRPNFVLLRSLRDRAVEQSGCDLPHLSMGMSNDYEAAIEEGATIIRIGTAIFGPRNN